MPVSAVGEDTFFACVLNSAQQSMSAVVVAGGSHSLLAGCREVEDASVDLTAGPSFVRPAVTDHNGVASISTAATGQYDKGLG